MYFQDGGDIGDEIGEYTRESWEVSQSIYQFKHSAYPKSAGDNLKWIWMEKLFLNEIFLSLFSSFRFVSHSTIFVTKLAVL